MQTMTTFTELNLKPELTRAIAGLQYETPSAIQAAALPILLGAPTDFIGLAATGTGKTAAFGIPLLERIDTTTRTLQGLILCPTRELAVQVAGQIALLGKHLGIRALPVYGGASFGDQARGLRGGVHIVVGTPGRLVDHLTRGTMQLNHLHTLILDEADEMISMGFKDDLEAILKASPRAQSNIWLFSATMSREVRRVADTYLRTPQQVQINKSAMLSSTVEQIYYLTKEPQKPDVLCRLIDAADDFYGLVFCQTKALVIDLTRYLTDRGYKVDCLHGDKDQTSRERTMQAFRDRRVSLLICTDVASRGLDVKDVTHVINYSISNELDSYVHRIGRTARSGKSGYAMSLVTPGHIKLIGRIEKMTNSTMKAGVIPTQQDINAKKLNQVLTQFIALPEPAPAQAQLSSKWKAILAGMDVQEIAARFLLMTRPEIFAEPKPATAASPIGRGPRSDHKTASHGLLRSDDYRKPNYGPKTDAHKGGPRKSFGPSHKPGYRTNKPSFAKPAFKKRKTA